MSEHARAVASPPFLGVGWSFPPTLGADGRVGQVADVEDIRQAIRIILGTDPGERLMRPDFGGGLHAFVFAPLNATTFGQVRAAVQGALIDWEPRIVVEEVGVRPQPERPNVLLIDITYRVRATNAVHNLVYPLYLEEGTAT